ncbi:MAG: hypothetical protein R3C68_06530 [Myxococcota bacterium]
MTEHTPTDRLTDDPATTVDDPPPLGQLGLGSWPRLYAVVLGALVGWILFFAWLTERYT